MSKQVVSRQNENEVILQKRNSNLLSELINNPSLPEIVKNLEPNTLNKLISTIGLEDCTDIISLATDDQIKHVLDIELWTNSKPGTEEFFNVGRFVNWLSVGIEVNYAFAAKMLISLGQDTFGWCLLSLTTVMDYQSSVLLDKTTNEDGLFSEAYEGLCFENYMVLPKEDECWIEVGTALQALWDEDPDYLLSVLRQCCVSGSVFGLTEGNYNHGDTKYKREKTRRIKGFVTPLDAAQFLEHSRNSSLDELLANIDYDYITRQYFDSNDPVRQQNGKSEALSETYIGKFDANELTANECSTVTAGLTDTTRLMGGLSKELDYLINQIEFILLDEKAQDQCESVRLLGSERQNESVEDKFILKKILAELSMGSDKKDTVLYKELAYLSNILVSGSEYQGRRFTESKSMEAVLATANLGVEFVMIHRFGDYSNMDLCTQYIQERGALINAFKVGFSLISDLPGQCIKRVSFILKSTALKSDKKHTQWILEEIEMGWKESYLLGKIKSKLFIEVKEQIEFLTLVLDNGTRTALNILVDSFPCFPSSFKDESSQSVYVNPNSRFIRSMDDLYLVGNFLEIIKLDV